MWAMIVEVAEVLVEHHAQMPSTGERAEGPSGLFRQGGSGAGCDVLGSEEVSRYHRRAAEMAPPDLLGWLHRAS
jgi:aryl sulfotransferase